MAPLKIRQAEQREPGKSRRQHSSRCADGLPKARFPKGRGSLVLDGPRTLLFAWIPRVMKIISVILGDADRRGPQRLLVLDVDADGQVLFVPATSLLMIASAGVRLIARLSPSIRCPRSCGNGCHRPGGVWIAG